MVAHRSRYFDRCLTNGDLSIYSIAYIMPN
jgi:hypothetical protein